MAARDQDVVVVPDKPGDGGDLIVGLVNTWQAQKYAEIIEKIFDDFQKLLCEDWKDALEVTVWVLKRHMAKTWPQLRSIHHENNM